MDKTMRELLKNQKAFAKQVAEFKKKLHNSGLSDEQKEKLQIALKNAEERLAEHQEAIAKLNEAIKAEIRNRKK